MKHRSFLRVGSVAVFVLTRVLVLLLRGTLVLILLESGHTAAVHDLFDLSEVLQVLANNLDLRLGILGAIVVTVEIGLRDRSEVCLAHLVILQVDGIVVKALNIVSTVVLELFVLAEAFEVIDGHQDLGELGDLLELS